MNLEPVRGIDLELRKALKYYNPGKKQQCLNLIAAGADVCDTRCALDIPALTAGAATGDADIVAAMLKAGATPNPKTPRQKAPLYAAVKKGGRAATALLITAGAKIDARNETGYTPLMVAASLGHIDIAKDLVAAGADINAVQFDGSGLLIHALHSPKSPDVLQYLVNDLGLDVNGTNLHGSTPLMIAAMRKNPQAVEALIDLGANVHITNKAGENALLLCLRHASQRHMTSPALRHVIRILMDKHIDINLRNNNGESAEDFAVSTGNHKLINLIRNEPQRRRDMFKAIADAGTSRSRPILRPGRKKQGPKKQGPAGP
ncbi:MAG: ankyrin repeat domain-containing protein [Alphaproteobacteria bacterium]|nr:ankyrin repeat domain-containing protein [Alphaproteobacteria bacterium]